jgi:hypothetical protein
MHSVVLLSTLASLSALATASPFGHGGPGNGGNGGWSSWWSNNHGGNNQGGNYNANNNFAVSTITVTALPTTFTSNTVRLTTFTSNTARPTGTSSLTRNTGVTTATGAPTSLPSTGPKINVSFFSDSACKTDFAGSSFLNSRDVFVTAKDQCSIDFPETYSSIIINSIDEAFIGSADFQFQIGNTPSAASRQCDFNGFISFAISNRDKIGQCQFVGIQQEGGPVLPGNNYQIVEFV